MVDASPALVSTGRKPSVMYAVGSSGCTRLMFTGRTASIGELRYASGDHCGPAIMPKPPPRLLDEIGDELELTIGELPRIDIAEQHDIVRHQLFDALGKSRDRPGKFARRIGRIAFLGEVDVGAGEQATDVHRLVADHLVFDVAIFPARIAVDIEHVDGRIHDIDRCRQFVVGVVQFAGLMLGDDAGDSACRPCRA